MFARIFVGIIAVRVALTVFTLSGSRGFNLVPGWCYGQGSNLIYNGRLLKKSERGQQGCPLTMPLFCAMKKEMRDRIPEAAGLDYSADFVDDGVDGGDCDVVFSVLEKEIALGPEYGSRNNYDLC